MARAKDISVTYNPPADTNFTGVHAYVQVNASVNAPLQLDVGALDAAVTAPPNLIDCGKFYESDGKPDASGAYTIVLTGLPTPTEIQAYRVYLASIGVSYDPPVVPYGQPGATPSILVTVDPRSTGQVGAEYAPLVTGLNLGTPETRFSQSGWEYRQPINWTDPTAADNADTIQNFAEVIVSLYPPAGGDVMAIGTPGLTSFGAPQNHPVAPGIQTWSDWTQIPDQQQTWHVSVFSVGKQKNTYSRFVTPQIQFTTPLLDPTGVVTAGTALADVTNFRVTVGYGYDDSGNFDLAITPYFTVPGTAGWDYMSLVCRPPNTGTFFNVLADPYIGDGSFGERAYIPRQFWPTEVQNWDFYAVSVDINGNPKYPLDNITPGSLGTSPMVTVTVSPQAGASGDPTQYADLVTAIYGGVYYYSLGSDGVERFGFSGGWVNPDPDVDPRFASLAPTIMYDGEDGKPVPLGAVSKDYTTFKTATWPVGVASGTLYFLSQDASGRTNPIVPGSTPGISFLITPQTTGRLALNRANPSSLKGTHLQIAGGQLGIAPQAIGSTELGYGAIADYSKFTNNLRPTEIVASLPTDFSRYPAGSAVSLASDPDHKLYRSTGSGWTSKVNGADIVVDAAFIGNVQAVNISAANVTAGDFNGRRLTLNLNGATTALNNNFGSVGTAGLTVTDNGTGIHTEITQSTLRVLTAGGSITAALDGNGVPRLYLYNPSTGYSIVIDPGSGFRFFSGSGQTSLTSSGLAISGTFGGTASVPYAKPGGGSGVMSFVGGMFTGAT